MTTMLMPRNSYEGTDQSIYQHSHEDSIPLIADNEHEPSETNAAHLTIRTIEKTYSPGGYQILSRFSYVLPRFLRPGGITARKITSTSYLDALRGYAAWIVLNTHAFNADHPTWRRQPFIIIFFSGTAMVSLFFLISGYVLSRRLLILIRNHEWEALLQSISSSSFRRYPRLYLPSAVAILFAMIMVRLGLYDGMPPAKPVHKGSFLEELHSVCWDILHFCNPFGDIRGWTHPGFFQSQYAGQLWSIPVEYRGSIALFMFYTLSCRLSVRSRTCLTWTVIGFCYVWQATYISLFLAGSFIADLSLRQEPQYSRSMATPKIRNLDQSRIAGIAYVCLFILALFILGQPGPDRHDLGILGDSPWSFLHAYVPSWWDHSGDEQFWAGIGSFALVYALEFYPPLQTPLKWKYSQYLGDLSFGIYALHPPIYYGLLWWNWDPSIRAKYLGESLLAHIPGAVLTTLAVFTVADYFDRIDKRTTNLTRWIQQTLFVAE